MEPRIQFKALVYLEQVWVIRRNQYCFMVLRRRGYNRFDSDHISSLESLRDHAVGNPEFKCYASCVWNFDAFTSLMVFRDNGICLWIVLVGRHGLLATSHNFLCCLISDRADFINSHNQVIFTRMVKLGYLWRLFASHAVLIKVSSFAKDEFSHFGQVHE